MQISYNYDNLSHDVLVFLEFSGSETAQVIGSNRDLGVIVSSRFTDGERESPLALAGG